MRLEQYQDDGNISLGDRLIGSDVDENGKTKEYSFSDIKAFLIAQGLGGGSNYKSYIGKFNQSGTNLPVVTEIFNNVFTGITWTRGSEGNFQGTITGGVFTSGKTFITNRRFCIFSSPSGIVNVYLQAYDSTFIVSIDDGTIGVDGNWFDFEIKVYN